MEILGIIWNEGFIRPMTNGLILLYLLLFSNFGLAIIVFTLIIRLATFPLALKQIHSSRAMAQLQPKLQELQKRYGSDRQRISQETFRLYRENGVNPIGCLGPLVVQMPIWIGLYWSLIRALPSNPESLAGLSGILYSGLSMVHSAVPLESNFLYLDLALPDPTPILPILVGGSMWVQQKMMTYPGTDPRQRQTNQIMLWMLPIMFVFFTFQFPSGLALYWVVSNLIGIAIQYFVTGWANLLPRRQPQVATVVETPQPAKELESDGASGNAEPTGRQPGQPRGDRPVRRRGHRAGAKTARRRPGGGRGRGS